MYLPKIHGRRQEISTLLNTVLVFWTLLNITPHILTLLYLAVLYMLTSVDIHPNPGPESSETQISTTSFLSDDIPNTSSYSELLKSGLSIVHLNIQSRKSQ